jgi:hypothetical protein
MIIPIKVAVHEAGHAIATDKSKYHILNGPIKLSHNGEGLAYIGLSKIKLIAGGKSSDASSQFDNDVVTDFAVISCSGLVAEQLFVENGTGQKSFLSCCLKCHIKRIPEFALNDYDLMEAHLSKAGLSKRTAKYEKYARQLLNSDWARVTRFAAFLQQNVNSDPTDVTDFIEQQN